MSTAAPRPSLGQKARSRLRRLRRAWSGPQLAFSAAAAATALGQRIRPLPPPVPSELLVLTAFTHHIADYGEISVENKKRYAARHGYAFECVRTGFDSSRAASWSKIPFIAERLASYRWIFWTDADALVMNGSIRLESFLYPEVDIVLSEAKTPVQHINAGHGLYASTPFTRMFLRRVWTHDAPWIDMPWEQEAINQLLSRYTLPRIRVVPNRLFNAFAELPGDPAPYTPGDFIVHFPGVPDKLPLMRRYAAAAN